MSTYQYSTEESRFGTVLYCTFSLQVPGTSLASYCTVGSISHKLNSPAAPFVPGYEYSTAALSAAHHFMSETKSPALPISITRGPAAAFVGGGRGVRCAACGCCYWRCLSWWERIRAARTWHSCLLLQWHLNRRHVPSIPHWSWIWLRAKSPRWHSMRFKHGRGSWPWPSSILSQITAHLGASF
jgi:hypothetical protein